MDVRSLTFPSSSFDCVLDKGTLDAILCGSDSSKHAHSMLSECQRVLRPGGCLLCITYGQPSSRLSYLEQRSYEWDVSYETLAARDTCTSAASDTVTRTPTTAAATQVAVMRS